MFIACRTWTLNDPMQPLAPPTQSPAARTEGALLSFLFAGVTLWWLISGAPDMLGGSGDANSIWITISQWDGARGPSSYVLYKGMLSVYPYVWLRELALAAGLDPFTFIRAWHALLFAVGSTLAVPAIASVFTGRPWNALQRCLFAVTLLWLTRTTRVYDLLMIDLPSWSFFAIACWTALRSCDAHGCTRLAWSAAAGGFIGLSLCGSGQFGLSALVMLAYLALRYLLQVPPASHAGRILLFAQLVIVVACAWVPREADLQFHAKIVDTMRSRGDWLPTAQQWVHSSVFRLMDTYSNSFRFATPSQRGVALLKDALGAQFETLYPQIKSGRGLLTIRDYIGLVITHPLDFAAMWTTRAFMVISLDQNRASASALLAGYTSVFLCLLLLVRGCNTLRDILRPELLLLAALLLTVAGPVALALEMRNALTIHSTMLAVAVQILTSRVTLNQSASASFTPWLLRRIPWVWVAYLAFITFCFGYYGVTMELTGSNPRVVLFTP
ncbi:hypothetical protein [Acidovorax temperans]|uniref:hypothetical protein n=1 Tax=Acidovorax temperans TaxID=80878 RepID=UPI0028A1C4C9|nr:hypothetical protein [Acidovorax temperans]